MHNQSARIHRNGIRFLILVLLVVCAGGVGWHSCAKTLREDWTQEMIQAAGQGDVPKVRQFLDKGISANAHDEEGRSALLRAVEGPFGNTTGGSPSSYSEVVSVLLAKGADANVRDPQDSKTALMVAAEQGYPQIVRLLLNHKAEVNAKDRYGRTALSIAAWEHTNCAKLLLQSHADPETRDKDGSTPLITAATAANLQSVQLLLAYGADTNAKTSSGVTTLMEAASPSWTSPVATAANSAAILQLLLAHGAEVNTKSTNGGTALIAAASSKYNSAGNVKILLDHGADIKAKTKDGSTALMTAVSSRWSNANTLQQLLDGGTDVNAQDTTGRTALMLAVLAEANKGAIYRTAGTDFVGLLLKHGANPNRKEKRGMTARMLARSERRPDIEAELKRAGATE